MKRTMKLSKKHIVCLSGILAFTYIGAFPQTNISLTIGDRLERLTITNVINHSEGNVTLGVENGKAILLDFGTTSCIPCIRSLTVLDSLRKAFSGKLEVFMVTKEKVSRVQKFLEVNPIGRSIDVPIIAEDTILHRLFRHVVQPHEVWIDKQMRIRAFTDHQYLTRENTSTLVAGAEIEWPVKWDFPYDYNSPIVVLNERNIPPLAAPAEWFTSSITSHMPGVRPKQYTKADSIAGTVRVGAINLSIAEMYATRLKRYWYTSFFPTHVLTDVDPRRLMYAEDFGYQAEWNEKNSYCYEMTFPLSIPEEERNRRIIQQLNWHFGLDVSLKDIKRPCWVLKSIDGAGVSGVTDDRGRGSFTVQDLVLRCHKVPQHPPLIDELDIDDSVRYSRKMAISDEAFSDPERLDAALRQYGMRVVVEEREVETLVVKKAS